MAYDMAGTLDLISLQLRQDMDIDPADAENAEWLDRGLSALKRVVKDVWEYADGADWDFTHTQSQVSVPASAGTGQTDGRVEAPTRFRRLGDAGWMAVAGQRRSIFSMPAQELFRRRELDPQRRTYPEFFTVKDWGTDVPFLYFWPYNTATFTANIGHELNPPVLELDNPGGLDAIPSELWETVLLVGLEDLMAAKGGDARSAKEWSPRFSRALADAYVARMHGLDQVQGARNALGRMRMW
jgi:hypothetical protein